MKRTALLIVLFTSAIAVSQTTPAQSALSPAERSMAAVHKLIDKNAKNFEAYNALALALSRRARETSDSAYYTQAEDALKKSFEISPNNFDGKRTAVWLLLCKHEFAAALDQATTL